MHDVSVGGEVARIQGVLEREYGFENVFEVVQDSRSPRAIALTLPRCAQTQPPVRIDLIEKSAPLRTACSMDLVDDDAQGVQVTESLGEVTQRSRVDRRDHQPA